MITTRLARPDEADALRELTRLAFEHYVPRIGREPKPMAADYADLVARGTTWVAEEAGVVVGLVVLVDQPGSLLVDILAVDPNRQGRGIGAQLLALAERQARERHRPEIRLCTNQAMTENLAYYPRRGFRETHRETQDGFTRVFFAKALAPPG